ncbi:hypothetical protein BDQ12DRAFT_323246 [Crucibulum laeve]|uniref:Uncharacterized protein n=1 Tax=Crucibulum laeve TaxID=68775 RepID=A0A5C3LTH6_9AGAR|nr:hypothetical protein BDQ12DRAFT_323246 [Crucibulum laeve]
MKNPVRREDWNAIAKLGRILVLLYFMTRPSLQERVTYLCQLCRHEVYLHHSLPVVGLSVLVSALSVQLPLQTFTRARLVTANHTDIVYVGAYLGVCNCYCEEGVNSSSLPVSSNTLRCRISQYVAPVIASANRTKHSLPP